MLKTNLFIFIFLSSTLIFSQDLKSVFLSVHSGIFSSSIDNFSDTYNSQNGFVYGFGVGLPLSSRTYIYGKATNFSKSGTPIIRSYNVINGQLVLASETREGTAKFNQWIINGGFLYNFFLNPDWTLGLNAGVTYSIVSEEQKNANGTIGYSSDGSGIFGFFIGSVLEKNFSESHFSIFIEPQYNFSRSDVLRYVGNYGGINLNIGIRYYFSDRRVE